MWQDSGEILKCHWRGVFGLFFVLLCFILLFSSKLKVITDNSIPILLATHIALCIFISLKAEIRLKLYKHSQNNREKTIVSKEAEQRYEGMT